ncbi:hypothetical protein A2334_02835 [Candidatus Roizmanbacteria bacterium RIFOXYB2_FULL_38_10]|uniref:F0F1 ATP synthase subunit n=1 Tax=Candidatus Roizmanbacteria bacterium RIFOXYD1_FULL_38_12 TaxID=1802093 RepID=A0A1F7L0A5_9BACT|nr:MAG: hypothetical protein A3K47_02165 [Candidatus Roizmanbacteria bacterium RIFOXYA2_FULL_38_14]OGK63582.1 MAG: hypothetical protein A3K27_02165 [Candidatus Roizmanbacteria bacterium RIFOXYA1_FULL_37_12]OGK65428.1 MAG: hypothetical protein A3K38_02165 [Candidatus Roizmanbacteria bacterium RIFOXYB1_FULL_40_23]OGK69095.1 MAG: hypothetical protein A2334_02835 [Candidatus Roizmanbacteria bacterium RIFOXYB2_FULL_38_10]OGK69833.1 MAG: hypothetical protein A3K21_02170 [Candidatus Roizmanbacteria ba
MDDRIYAENKFKIGSDFELRPLKKKDQKYIRKSAILSEGEEYEVFLSKKKETSEKKDGSFHGLQYTHLGFYLITPILMGVALGIYIDRFLGTKPVVTLTLIMCGGIATFYNLLRLIKKN